MKGYSQRPIPLVIHENKKYQVNPQALQFFASIQGKIAVISVAGVYRTGKSFLLNTILLNQKNGFAVGPTTNPKTKGIWVWGKPLILKNEHDEIINVCVLDSQGLGSTEEDINHDLRLLSITLLLSSSFLYNTLGAIDENAIDSLGLVLRLCEHLKSQNSNDFPDFYWILRDFSLALVDKDNTTLTPNMYLENCLSSQPGDSQIRNRIRTSIRSAFINRSCKTFVRPLTDESCLQSLDKMELDELRPEFVEQVIDFRKTIFSGVKTKKIRGKEVSADTLVELIKIYVAEINEDKLPVIQTGWKYVCKRECELAMEVMEKQIEERVNCLSENLPNSRKDLQDTEEQILNDVKKMFASRTDGNEQTQAYFGEINNILRRRMKRVEEQMRKRNSQETKAFIKRQFEYIERKLKQGEFKAMSQLVKEFELFYQYYRKKCPFKDEVQAGLQSLMKKFSDCSVILFKNFKNKKDAELTQLREEWDKLVSDAALRDQKSKQEKSAAQNINAVLESKIEQLQRQNKTLSSSLLVLEQEVDRQRAEADVLKQLKESETELEIIASRKKLMECADALKELECQKAMEVSSLRNMLTLKDNEIAHLHEEKFTLCEKISEEGGNAGKLKEEKAHLIESHTAQLKQIGERSETTRRSQEEKIMGLQTMVSRLESLLEKSKEEMEGLLLQKSEGLAAVMSSFEGQKKNLVLSVKEELRVAKEQSQQAQAELIARLRRLEAEAAQREVELKTVRMEIEKERAVLGQKVEFLQRECTEKEEKIARLIGENSSYLSLFEEKQSIVTTAQNALSELRAAHQTVLAEINFQLVAVSAELAEKTREVLALEEDREKCELNLREKTQLLQLADEKSKSINKALQQKLRELTEKAEYDSESAERNRVTYERELETIKSESIRLGQEQKRNAELSLVQLKNYYEMQRERLQKRLLEERKRHEQNEWSSLEETESRHRKALRFLQEECMQHKNTIQQLEEQLAKVENQCELKIMNEQEERQNEQRLFAARCQALQKKLEELTDQMEHMEKTHEEERIGFVKKIETLNFEVSRKDKQHVQAVGKREAVEATLVKKDVQIENIKRLMNQQIESSLRKVAEVQAKYQKLNEEHMQLKIDSDKEIALSKQRNQFLSAKLADLAKDRQIGSSKNLEKLDKLKITDLREQTDKARAQLAISETKLEAAKKAQKDSESVLKKTIGSLEKENAFLNQKLEINQSKCTDLQARITSKNEIFLKELEESREKFNLERNELQRELDSVKQRLGVAEDERSEASWKLQKEGALLNDRIKYAEYQRDQAKKELEENEKRLQLAFVQLKKSSEKASEENQVKKTLSEKKHTTQLEGIKESMRVKLEQCEETIRRQRDEIKLLKDKNLEITERLHRVEKGKNIQKILQEENEALKKEKEAQMAVHRGERGKQTEEWKRKLAEAERRNKELQRTNNTFVFTLQKEQTKWSMQRQNLLQRARQVQEALEFERSKWQLGKSKLEVKKEPQSGEFSKGWK